MKLYTSDFCLPCKLLKKALREHRIAFEEIKIDNREGQLAFQRIGAKAIPVLEKDGQIFVGLIEIFKKLKEDGLIEEMPEMWG